jgi:hypothetical protein
LNFSGRQIMTIGAETDFAETPARGLPLGVPRRRDPAYGRTRAGVSAKSVSAPIVIICLPEKFKSPIKPDITPRGEQLFVKGVVSVSLDSYG